MLTFCAGLLAQETGPAVTLTALEKLPDAPQPPVEIAADPRESAPGGAQEPPSTSTPAQDNSNSVQSASQQSSSPGPSPQQTQREKAEEQIRRQEHQRVLGIVPQFNTSYVSNAVSLTPGQKIDLAFHSAVDPFTFGAAFLVTGLHEALDEDQGFGWGAEGFGKRSGAAYLDAFDGTMIGNGLLPALFHQDPRYFRLGHGTFHRRLLYSLATSYICKHDNTGKWQPNFSNVGGNIIAGGISNLYYPSQNSGWGQTITNGLIVTTEGTIGGVFQEFWPDISRKFLHKDPTDGLDAQAQAEDRRKKAEKSPK